MKVHHIINDIGLQNGGAQRVVRQLHHALRKDGIDSRLVALCHPTDDVSAVICLGNEKPYGAKSFLTVVNYIRSHCSPEDTIHAHLFPTMLYVSLATKLLGWKGNLVCTEHSTHNRRRDTRVGRLIDRLIYPAYDHIYCISNGVKKSLASWLSKQESKLKVIENGVELPYENHQTKKVKERLIIVSAGRLHTLKNYETAIAAMAQLNDIDYEYRIAGIGPEGQALKALCNRLGVDDKVHFYGYVMDIFDFFKQADIFLIPSLWEGFGLAAVEAMNCGLPVIASNVDGLREVIDTKEKCGILVSAKSSDEITNSIRFFCEIEKRNYYGKNAFKRSRFFSIERMTQKYIYEYKNVEMK